jgi:hypothetical protein
LATELTLVTPRAGADAGQTSAFWARLSTTNPAALTLAEAGIVGGEDIAPGTFTYFPAIAVNRAGDMNIGFAASAPTIYAGAFGTGRRASDAPGTLRGSVVIRAGTDYYIRTFGSSRNRWGDYTGIALDPSNDKTTWIFNQYAAPRGTTDGFGHDGVWGTVWGSLDFQR